MKESPSARFAWLWLKIVLGVAAAGLPLLNLLLLPAPHDLSVAWLRGLWKRKLRWAQLAGPAPRVLIAGGSSGLFSLDAEVLEARLHRPVYNLSTHAGLGLRFLLNDAREAARPGDTILLCVEDSLYRQDPSPVGELEQEVIWSGRFRRLVQLPWPVLIGQLYGQPWTAYRKGWTRRNEAMSAVGAGGEAPILYSSTELSARGDFRGQIGPVPAGFAPLGPVLNEGVASGPAAELRGFRQWCERRGVHVLATAPAAYRAPGTGAKVAQGVSRLRAFYEEQGLGFIEADSVLSLPRELLLDTPLHANSAGRRVITEALATELQRHFSIPLPNPGAPLLLVAGRESTPARETAFADQEISACRFLTAETVASPLCVTVQQVSERRREGTRFVFADPEVARLLEEAGVSVTPGREISSALADWMHDYPAAWFALLTTGGQQTASLAPGLPEPFHSFLLRPELCKAAVFGPGVQLTRTHRKFAELQLAADDRAQRESRYPASFLLHALDPKAGRSTLLIERSRNLASATEDGLQVAVYDPETGRVVKSGIFSAPSVTEAWLREVR